MKDRIFHRHLCLGLLSNWMKIFKSSFQTLNFVGIMLEDVEFITALRNNDFIKSIIANNSFSKVNVSQFDYTEEWDDHYKFRNFPIGRWIFDSVNISLSTSHLTMVFWITDLAFADELPLF